MNKKLLVVTPFDLESQLELASAFKHFTEEESNQLLFIGGAALISMGFQSDPERRDFTLRYFETALSANMFAEKIIIGNCAKTCEFDQVVFYKIDTIATQLEFMRTYDLGYENGESSSSGQLFSEEVYNNYMSLLYTHRDFEENSLMFNNAEGVAEYVLQQL